MAWLWRIFVVLMLAVTVPASAEESVFEFGGDVFSAGESALISTETANDVFAAGNTVQITADVGGDTHTAGNNILISGNITGNVYAGGNSVSISGNVGKDLMAAGSTLTISSSQIGGNARLAGSTIDLNSDVSGSVIIGARTAKLNGVIQGDFNFGGETLTFGEGAKILGNVTLKGPNQIEVPQTVASADRVTFVQASDGDGSFGPQSIVRETASSFWPGFLPGFAPLIIAFLVGVIWLALMPDRSTMAYMVSKEKPFKSLFIGILGLSMFFGLMVVLGVTLLGIPLIPVALVLLVLAWALGYVGGAYFLSARVLEAFGQRVEGLGFQVIALVLGLVIAWILSMAPFVGWLTQVALVFFGLGAMGLAMVYRRSGSPYHTELHDRLRAE